MLRILAFFHFCRFSDQSNELNIQSTTGMLAFVVLCPSYSSYSEMIFYLAVINCCYVICVDSLQPKSLRCFDTVSLVTGRTSCLDAVDRSR